MELKTSFIRGVSLLSTLMLSAALAGPRAQAIEVQRLDDDRGSPAAVADLTLAASWPKVDAPAAPRLMASDHLLIQSDLLAPGAAVPGLAANEAAPPAKPKHDTFSALEPDTLMANQEPVKAEAPADAPLHFLISGLPPAAAVPQQAAQSEEETFHFVGVGSVAPAPVTAVNLAVVEGPALQPKAPASSEDAPFRFRGLASVEPITAPLASNGPDFEAPATAVAQQQPESASDSPFHFKVTTTP